MEGFTCGSRYFPKWGLARESGDADPPAGFRGKALVGGLGESPPIAEANVKYLYNFNVFLQKIKYLINRSSNLVQTHKYKNTTFNVLV